VSPLRHRFHGAAQDHVHRVMASSPLLAPSKISRRVRGSPALGISEGRWQTPDSVSEVEIRDLRVRTGAGSSLKRVWASLVRWAMAWFEFGTGPLDFGQSRSLSRALLPHRLQCAQPFGRLQILPQHIGRGFNRGCQLQPNNMALRARGLPALRDRCRNITWATGFAANALFSYPLATCATSPRWVPVVSCSVGPR